MFDTKNNKLMNNAIVFVAPKIKTMTHIMGLNNRILCVVGITIFEFKKYWQTVYNLMEHIMIPNFKKFLKSETENSEKK